MEKGQIRYKNKRAKVLFTFILPEINSAKNEAEILSCVDEMIHQDLNHSVQEVNEGLVYNSLK